MPSREEHERRLTSHEIATLHVRRTKLVSALRAYMETNDRPFWWIATEIGVAKSALRNWQNGKVIPKSVSLDRIERFLEWQKYAGRSSSQILNAFRRFYCETSLSDYAIARMIGIGPAPIPFWIKGIRTPQLASLRKLERFMQKHGKEYLRGQ
jgi:DNA-binding transcriptional regulator YiaG